MSWLYTLVFAGLLISSNTIHSTRVTAVPESKIQRTAVAAQDETERFEQTYPLTPNGRVGLSNVNGSIVINAWDRSEVRLIAVKTADSKERLADIQIKVDSKPDSLSVATDYGDWKAHNGVWHNNGKLQVDYELTIPRGAELNEIETVNGSVTVGDFTNYTKISAVNGSIKATNLRGTANLSTVNGEVYADFTQLNGGSKVYLETVNGRVNLSIPSDSRATLRADSVNGPITNDFGLPVRKGQYVGRDLYGRLGPVESQTMPSQVKLSSVNGPLTINRNKDGKSLSPPTDLLPQKNKDDDDWDDNDKDSDDTSMAMNAKINKQVEKSVKQSQKDTEKALREMQKAVKVGAPNIKVEVPEIKIAVPEVDVNTPKVDVDIPSVKIDTEALTKAAADIADIQSQVNMRMRDISFSGMPRVEKKSDSIPVKGSPKVTITAPGCSVKVRGWDKQEVQYNVVQYSSNRNRTFVQTNESHSDTAVNINVNSDKRIQKDDLPIATDRVHVEVFVPKRSDLKITTDGEIRLDGVSGQIDLSGSEGSIDVRDSDGKMKVATACGQVRVIGFHGEVDARTTAGDIYLEGSFDKLSGNAANGTIVLTLPSDTSAKITSNSEVEAEGIDLTKDDDSTWRLGSGLRKYDFNFGDGHLVVRNLSEISK